MASDLSFGQWVHQRRKALDMTQRALAQQIGCALSTIQKIEIDARQPSRQIAELLLEHLEIEATERDAFLQLARHVLQDEQPLLTPIASSRQPINNLPTPLTSLVGREWEVATVHATLLRPEVRLLTLTGPPGIGKTRLALYVATQAVEHFADGVCFVPLAAIGETRFVLAAIAHALGLNDTGSQPLLERVKRALHDRKLLLILDNFEHLLPAGPLIAELLESAPHLKVLVTSRALLQLYGENEFVTPPLALPNLKQLPAPQDLASYAAIELFIQRARASKLDFVLSSDNANAVAELCVHLDGLPLAIELAAARSKSLTPEVLLARLAPADGSGTCLTLLASDAHNLPPRQQTLRNAIAWSYDLLNPTEQRIFRCMAVFADGFTLDTLNKVVRQAFSMNGSPTIIEQDDRPGIAEWLLHTAEGLVKQSLVVQRQDSGTQRFSLLETLREFALLQLEQENEVTAAHYAHARTFALIAENFKNAAAEEKADPLLRLMELEINNFRKALLWADANDLELVLRLAVALSEYWSQRQHLSEGRLWLERLCVRLKDDSSSWPLAYQIQYAEMSNMLAFFTFLQGDSRLAQSRWAETISLWRAQQNQAKLGRALYFLACTLMDRGEYRAALDAALESFTVLQTVGDDAMLGWTLSNIGRLMTIGEEYAKATDYFEQALGIYQRLGHQWSICMTKLDMCDLLFATGEIGRAHITLEEILPTFQKVDHLWMVVRTLHLLGKVHWLQGFSSKATEVWNEALRLATEIDARFFLAAIHCLLGITAQAHQAQEEAQRHFYESLDLYRMIENESGVAYAVSGLASLHDSPIIQAQLLAAASKVLDMAKLPTDMIERQYHKQLVRATRMQLNEVTFAVAWDLGRSMTLEEAMRCVELSAPNPRR